MLTIWGRISSVNVQRVVWAAGEVGQPFERIDVGGPFGGLETPSYRDKNPNSQIPVIEDGEVVIWESNSIVRYLAARYGAGWIWDEDPARRSMADRWMDWTIAEQQPAMGPAFLGLMRTPAEQRDAASIEASRARTEAKMAVLEQHLAQNEFLAGARFGMADITLGPCVHRWLNLPLQRIERPHVARWYGVIAARPAAQAALPFPIL